MLRETTNKIFYVLIVFLATQIVVRFLYSYVGDDIGMLGLFPSFLFGWFWGPLFGFIGAVLTVIATSINFFTMGSTLADAFANVFGMAVTIVLSIGFGFFSKILKKNNRLTKELERKSNTLSKILEEKNSAEESLIQKIELIRFTNQISADFINVPAVFLESRIDNALKQIIDFIDARSCCIYINKEGKDYTLFKEYFNNKSISTIPYLYKIEYEKLSDFIDTFLTHPILVIEKKVWNHEIFDLFQTDNAVLLPMLSSNKLTGFIFFEKENADNDWQLHYNDIFQLVKQVIFTALERLFAEEKIVSQYEELKRYSESLFKTNVKLNNLNETLISTSNALMESESRFRELSENIEDIIWLQEGRKILYVNNAYNKILGLKRENLYKNTLDFIKRIHPEDREELLKSYSNHNYDIHGIFRAEFRYFGINGEIKYMEARSFLISRDNKKSKIAGIAEDITLKKKAEKEIKSALFKALELNQLKTKFITTVSHQLRTPFRKSSLSTFAVKKMKGVTINEGLFLIFSKTQYPSFTCIIISQRIKSGKILWATS